MRLGDQIEELENAEKKEKEEEANRKKEQYPPNTSESYLGLPPPGSKPVSMLNLPKVPTTPPIQTPIKKKVGFHPTNKINYLFDNHSDSDSDSDSDSNETVGSEIQQPIKSSPPLSQEQETNKQPIATPIDVTGKSCDDIIVRINDNKYTDDIKQIDLSIFVPSKNSRVIIRNYANNTEAELVQGLSDFSKVNTPHPDSSTDTNNNSSGENSNVNENSKQIISKENPQNPQVDTNKKQTIVKLMDQKKANNESKLDPNFSDPNKFGNNNINGI